MKRGIDRMIREFKRDQMRITSEQKRIKKDLERMVKKNEPRVRIRIPWSGILTFVDFAKNIGIELP